MPGVFSVRLLTPAVQQWNNIRRQSSSFASAFQVALGGFSAGHFQTKGNCFLVMLTYSKGGIIVSTGELQLIQFPVAVSIFHSHR